MKKWLAAYALGLCTLQVWAHAPFVAPSSYLVQGGNTAILAGFAEAPFDSEVAIRGFEFQVIHPQGENKSLELTNVSSISTAAIETAQAGSYQIVGVRSGNLKYAKVGQRWLRVLDAKQDTLPPLQQRHYITPVELKPTFEQLTVNREDQLLSYFSKTHSSALHTLGQSDGLQVRFATHPNLLTAEQPLALSVTINNQPAKLYDVKVEKQSHSEKENRGVQNLKTDANGKLNVAFKGAGQYLLTITSPEAPLTVKPEANSHRTIISLWVNE